MSRTEKTFSSPESSGFLVSERLPCSSKRFRRVFHRFEAFAFWVAAQRLGRLERAEKPREKLGMQATPQASWSVGGRRERL